MLRMLLKPRVLCDGTQAGKANYSVYAAALTRSRFHSVGFNGGGQYTLDLLFLFLM